MAWNDSFKSYAILYKELSENVKFKMKRLWNDTLAEVGATTQQQDQAHAEGSHDVFFGVFRLRLSETAWQL